MKAGKAVAIGCGAFLGLSVLLGVVGSCTSSMMATRQAAQDAAAKQRREERKAAEDAKFTAMTPEQHTAEARKALDANQSILAERHLKALPAGTASVAELQQRLTTMQAKEKAEQAAKGKAAREEMAFKLFLARKEFAKKLETNYLDKGLNVDVTTEGKSAEVLKIKWVLTSKVAAHELSKGDVIEAARALGFKKVRLTNGFSSSLAEGYTWDLTKN